MKTKRFIEKARDVHGDKYIYSEVVYSNNKTKVSIVCKEHGVFGQIPNSHLSGKGCMKCRKTRPSLTTDQFVKRAEDVHGNRYDYNKTQYNKSHNKVEIICREHGSFMQPANDHLKGSGCRKCYNEEMAARQTLTTDKFTEKAKKVHGGVYGYTEVNYLKAKTKVKIECLKHGIFEQLPNDHLNGHGCQRCANLISTPETHLLGYLEKLLPFYTTYENSRHRKINSGQVILHNNRGLIKSLNSVPGVYAELDIVIPKLKLAFEFNGVHFHSTKYKDRDYHKLKTEACKKVGLRLIHIWEDDWREKQSVIKSFLSSLIKPIPTIFGRKTNHDEVGKAIAKEFLAKNHIQGSTVFTEAYALYYKGKVVSVCTFVKRGYGYELNRHSCQSDVRVVGALGKHIKNFKKFHPDSVVKSFCDLSMFNGGSYKKAGFELEAELAPDYKYVVGGERKHKFGFRRKHLPNFIGKKFNPKLSEVKNMENNGFYRIFDCGKLRFIYG